MNESNFSTEQQQYLLDIAKHSIEYGVLNNKPMVVDLKNYPKALKEERATFVTLEKQGQLRGCIGMLDAVRPLVEDVAANAYSAAFSDPRFAPVAQFELIDLRISISILTPAQPMHFTSEQDLINQIKPHVDGLILSEGRHRGTFLPSVWSSLPNKVNFLQQLKLKAGLAENYWSSSIKVERYRTESIK